MQEDNQQLNAFREQGTGNREQGKEIFGFKKVFLQIWDAPLFGSQIAPEV